MPTLQEIADELLIFRKYPSNEYDRPTLIEIFPGISYLDAGEILINTDNPMLKAIGYWTVGRTLGTKEKRLNMENIGYFCKSMYYNDKFVPVLISLGNFGMRIRIPGGNFLTMEDFFLRAVHYSSPGNLYATNEMHGYSLSLLASSMKESMKYSILLLDGRVFTQRGLYMEAFRVSPYNPDILAIFAENLEKYEIVTFPDGKSFTKIQLFYEALVRGGRKMPIYGSIACIMDPEDTITLPPPDGRILGKNQLLLETLHMCPNFTPVKKYLQKNVTGSMSWSCHTHILYGNNVHILFATFLLTLQRLEDEKYLQLAHQAMIEDILTFWKWEDDSSWNRK